MIVTLAAIQFPQLRLAISSNAMALFLYLSPIAAILIKLVYELKTFVLCCAVCVSVYLCECLWCVSVFLGGCLCCMSAYLVGCLWCVSVVRVCVPWWVSVVHVCVPCWVSGSKHFFRCTFSWVGTCTSFLPQLLTGISLKLSIVFAVCAVCTLGFPHSL